MIPFGLVFIGMDIYAAVYNHHNVTSKDRYSFFDIVDEDEEADPLNERYEKKSSKQTDDNIIGTSVGFCPYCGKPVDSGFDFCPKCGKNCRINLENKVHKKITKILALAIDKC